MILKTNRLKEAEETTEEISKLLYHLEDLNDYRKNGLNNIIEQFNKIKWVER